MQRFCLTLELRNDPVLVEEYRFWHRPENIWTEITEGIKKVGIENMEIYQFGTVLFMIIEAPDDFTWDEDMKTLASLPRQAEWENFMSKFQKASPYENSSEKWKIMDRIFSLNPKQ